VLFELFNANAAAPAEANTDPEFDLVIVLVGMPVLFKALDAIPAAPTRPPFLALLIVDPVDRKRPNDSNLMATAVACA
tara:strand:- start:384 stop:617 length:234 start_codon:yes stop_codon:yes gene_type:complete